jgi:hypothetical protein
VTDTTRAQSSPFQQQYAWEVQWSHDRTRVHRKRDCECGQLLQWGWCPKCTPLHYAELP